MHVYSSARAKGFLILRLLLCSSSSSSSSITTPDFGYKLFFPRFSDRLAGGSLESWLPNLERGGES